MNIFDVVSIKSILYPGMGDEILPYEPGKTPLII